MLQDIFHFLFDLKCSIFPVFTLFRLHKIQVYFQIHPTSFTENFMKVFDEDFALLPGDHRIRKFHTHGILSGKRKLCSAEQIVLQHIVAAQLQLHTGTVAFQEILRCVLLGKMKFFHNGNSHGNSRKTLPFNLILQGKDIFLVDPAAAFDINPQMSSSGVHGNLCHKYHVQKFFQLFLHFKMRKYIKKIFLHYDSCSFQVRSS